MAEAVQNVDPVLPEDGFLRLAEVLRLVPVSKTAWFKGISEGRFPRGVKLTKRAVGYRSADIRALLDRLSRGEGVPHE